MLGLGRSGGLRVVGLALSLLAPLAGRLRADIPPPPQIMVNAMPSSGCDMDELNRAVEEQRRAVLSCIGRDYPKGTIDFRCSFDGEGKLVKCESSPAKSSGQSFSKLEIECATKALGSLHLDPKAGDPSKCTAHIEVRSQRGAYRSPQRPPPPPILMPTSNRIFNP